MQHINMLHFIKASGKRLLGLVLLIFLVTFVGCGSESSKDGSKDSLTGGVIHGRVTAASGISFTVSKIAFQETLTGTVGVSGAVCTIEGTDKSAVTDDDGFFQIADVAEGSYIVICKKTANDGKVYAFLNFAEVKPGETTDLGTIEIKKTGSIQGTAALTDQIYHTGITVYIPGTSMQAKTDAAGNYQINDVPVGTYEVRFEKSGYMNGILSSVHVTSGEVTLADTVTLNLSTGVTGSISIENGQVYSNSRTVSVSFSASDDAVLYQISAEPNFIGSAWNPIPLSRTWIFDSDGEKRLYVKFADANGLESAPVSDDIIIDTTPPINGSVTINDGASTTDASTVALTISATDATTSVEQMMISNDPEFTGANWEVLANTLTWNLTDGEGTKTVYIRFRDVVGNVSEVASAAIFLDIDMENPVISNISANSGISSAIIQWETDEPTISRLDYGLTEDYGSTEEDTVFSTSHAIKITNLSSEMLYHYRIISTDAVGNTALSIDSTFTTIKIISVSAGGDHTCAVTASGGVKCWGSNGYGQLGNGTYFSYVNSSIPVDVVGLSTGVIAVSAGKNHTCALTTSGGVRCWGSNKYGQIGTGTTISRFESPTDAVGLSTGIIAISAGGRHTCALIDTGVVKCWGILSSWGENTTSNHPETIPRDVWGLSTDITAISSGYAHTCALTTSGGIKCWGYCSYGQLGDGILTQVHWCDPERGPNDVVGLSTGVTAISTGGNHTCALTTSDGVKCWGRNSEGQIGDGTTSDRNAPVDVTGLPTGVAAIFTGDNYTCALTDSGEFKFWGNNSDGQFGDGTIIDSLIPVDVADLSSWVTAISLGGSHTCGLTASGGVRCWGSNFYGQLGDGTTESHSLPVDVELLH